MVGVGFLFFFYECMWFLNYGSCIDVYGWGENVDIIIVE